MASIREMQDQHRAWLSRNFPEQKSWDPFVGMVEEVGELAHVLLKRKQKIRGGAFTVGDEMAMRAMEIDAIGDIFVYMMSYCNSNDLDLEEVVSTVWGEVLGRDWVEDPVSGGQ